MKPVHKKNIISKASGSTGSDINYSSASVINEAGTQVNNNTKTMASLMLQLNSTKTMLIIILAGITAYIIMHKDK